VPKRIRTSGLWIRNPMLYPAELWAHEPSRFLAISPAASRGTLVYVVPSVPPCPRRDSTSLSTGSLSGILALARPQHPCLRRGGDSNPRYPLGVQRLSRAPDSATLAPLHFQHPLHALSRLESISLTFPLASVTMGRGKRDRRGRDSNPRNREAAQRFSRPPPSTTRTPLPSIRKCAGRNRAGLHATAQNSRSTGILHYTD
jgi:hypothetical protein